MAEIIDPIVLEWVGKARGATTRLNTAISVLDDLLFAYEYDGVQSVIAGASPEDTLEESVAAKRTVADLRKLISHLKLTLTAAAGTPGITGITNLQAQGNALGNDYDPVTPRRLFSR